MRAFITWEITRWKREHSEHARLAHLLGGMPIAGHAEHYARRARRHLQFWSALSALWG